VEPAEQVGPGAPARLRAAPVVPALVGRPSAAVRSAGPPVEEPEELVEEPVGGARPAAPRPP